MTQKIISPYASIIVLLICFIASTSSYAQLAEYRITDEGVYQLLNNAEEAGNVYDETRGTYYKNITVRSFFLAVKGKGYVPADLSYNDFIKMSIPEQREAVSQPYAKPTDCSIGQPLPIECLVFKDITEGKLPQDNHPKKINSKKSSREIEAAKIILNEK